MLVTIEQVEKQYEDGEADQIVNGIELIPRLLIIIPKGDMTSLLGATEPLLGIHYLLYNQLNYSNVNNEDIISTCGCLGTTKLGT